MMPSARSRRRTEPREFSAAEEAANTVTHGLGAMLATVALAALLQAAAPVGRHAVAAVAVFGGTLVLVYLSSALHHGLTRPGAKRLFLFCDRCAIYLLIAGTYTPVAVLALEPPLGRGLILAIWSLAAIGIALEAIGHWREGAGRCAAGGSGLGPLAWVTVVLYLVMGWLGFIVAGDALAAQLRPAAFNWLIAGGVVYTVGVGFFLWRRLRYAHAVWHLFAVAGSACHVWSILAYILPDA